MDEEPYYMCSAAVDSEEDLGYGEEDMYYGEDSLQEGGGGEDELLSCLDEESEAASSVDDQSLEDGVEDSFAQLLLNDTQSVAAAGGAISYRVSLLHRSVPSTSSPALPTAAVDTASSERPQQPSLPLTPSLFSYRPPSIHFPLHNEPCEHSNTV